MSRISNSRRTSFHVHFPYITLQLLDKIRVVLGEFPEVEQAYIFWVHAIWNAKPSSDIDMALSGEMNHALLQKIHDTLEKKLSISRNVHTISLTLSTPEMRSHIEWDGIKLYDVHEAYSDPHSKRKKKEVYL